MGDTQKEIVGVQGLGFVGFVMSIVLANAHGKEYDVLGFEINKSLIDNINKGTLPIKSTDPLVEKFYQNSLKKNNFRATSDPKLYSLCDTIVVDINLDVQKSDNFVNDQNYDVDLTSFKRGIKSIGEHCKENALILVETTVPPGTCEKIVKPIIFEELTKRGLGIDHIKIGHSYERVMPGPNYVHSIINFHRAYSGIDKKSEKATKKFLETFIDTNSAKLQRLGSTTASETAKVLENSYRAMNIAFIDEWTKFSENAGINLFEIIETIRIRPTHQNIMYPGFGVGGYCLTKDPLLASWSSKTFFNHKRLYQSENAVRVNDLMPLHTFTKIVEEGFNNPKILVLGISYLKNIGDLRYAPFLKIESKLKELTETLHVYDPLIEKTEYPSVDLEFILNDMYDVVLIGCPHDCFFDDAIIEKVLSNNIKATVVDPFNCLTSKEIINKKIVIGNGQ